MSLAIRIRSSLGKNAPTLSLCKVPNGNRAIMAASDSNIRALLKQKDYWRSMYRSGEDVFTLDDVNKNLKTHFAQLEAVHRKDVVGVPRVLVPLCGKDISMAWIARQGIGAVGVDFVDEPLRALGNEVGGLVPIHDEPRMGAYSAALLRTLILVHADFMALEEGDYGGRFEGVWDRAALTALPPATREAYVAKLYRLLVEGGGVLVEALTCNLALHGAMTAEDLRSVFERGGFRVIVLSDTDARTSYPAFSPPGLQYLKETILLATKRDAL